MIGAVALIGAVPPTGDAALIGAAVAIGDAALIGAVGAIGDAALIGAAPPSPVTVKHQGAEAEPSHTYSPSGFDAKGSEQNW
ncbi:hypothetical protein ACQCVE_16010 [Metabacillus sp. 113a]|uniref:hypothetical protein n=1 Tax=Metabacillus sp. 113a TaxID=3404706 RepID=UPI003CFB7AEE